MTVYISTDSIVESYNELSSMNFKNASILQVFLVLKGINIDKLIYRNTDEIKNRGLEYAQELGSLFSDFEKKSQVILRFYFV